MPNLYVKEESVVRKIWGKADTVLFIFAGSAAEFALNKAVDWLYFTGKLPADPLGRLFSTVAYARQIIFSNQEEAVKAINRITAIHNNVEQARGAQIPDWAYRDVLFMLIDYSIRAFELLEHRLSAKEKDDVFAVFRRVGASMHLSDLPDSYAEWVVSREYHSNNDLISSRYTADLFAQYRKHLGPLRYYILRQVQHAVVPLKIRQLLPKSPFITIKWLLLVYKLLRFIKLAKPVKNIMLPDAYRSQIAGLDI